MKKIMNLAIFSFSVLFFCLTNVGSAEAAWVAVLPIEVNEANVERANDFTNYYWDAIVNRFKYPDYELLDDDKLIAVVPEKGLASYDRSALADIAMKTDADIVIAMRLDSVGEELTSSFSEERMIECSMNGEFASYNRLTDKYYDKKFNYRDNKEEALIIKNDWQYFIFNSDLNRYINHTLRDKNNSKKK